MNTENNNQRKKDLIVFFGLVIIAIAMIVIFVFAGSPDDKSIASKTENPVKDPVIKDNSTSSQEPIVNNDNTIDTNKKSNETEKVTTTTKALPKLIDLGSTRCKPCIAMEPILEELRNEYNGVFNVEFINVNENRAEAQKYNINLIPTQIFFDANGTELFRHVGFYSKEEIINKWKELGFNLKK